MFRRPDGFFTAIRAKEGVATTPVGLGMKIG
jgi:hypothetical protein